MFGASLPEEGVLCDSSGNGGGGCAEAGADSPRRSDAARRPSPPTTWTIDLVGQRLNELSEEQRLLRGVPKQLSQLAKLLENISARLGESGSGGFGPGHMLPSRRGSVLDPQQDYYGVAGSGPGHMLPSALPSRRGSMLDPQHDYYGVAGSRCASKRVSMLSQYASEAGGRRSSTRSAVVAPVATTSVLPNIQFTRCGSSHSLGSRKPSLSPSVSSPVPVRFPNLLQSSAPAPGNETRQPATSTGSGSAMNQGHEVPRSSIWSTGTFQDFGRGIFPKRFSGTSLESDCTLQDWDSPETEANCIRSSVESQGPGLVDVKDVVVDDRLSSMSLLSVVFGRPVGSRLAVKSQDIFWTDSEHTSVVMDPAGRIRLAWDVLCLIIVVVSGVFVPVMVAYHAHRVGDAGDYAMLMLAVDVCWISGIFANFLTATMDADDPVYDMRVIAAQYLQGFFLVDLISAWPSAISPPVATDLVARLLFSFKIFRLSRLAPLLSKLQQALDLPRLMHVKRGIQTFLLVHLLSCGWQLVQQLEEMIELPPREACGNAYVRDLYWTFMTITTVGYGDVVPQGPASRAYAILTMLVAMAFNGTVVSVITHYTAGVFNDKVEAYVAEVSRFMARRQVSKELRGYVESNLRHRIRIEQQMLSQDIFGKLSPALQRELSFELLRDVILRFPLFRQAKRAFVAELASAHVRVQCLAGDVIVEDGQVLQELIFVMSGRLIVGNNPCDGWTPGAIRRTTIRGQGYHKELDAGAWFGEECLFTVQDVEEVSEEEDDQFPAHSEEDIRLPAHSEEDAERHMSEDDTDEQPQMQRGSTESARSGTQTSLCSGGKPLARRLHRTTHRTGTITAFEEAELAVLPAQEYWRVCRKFPVLLRRHQKICKELRLGRLHLDRFSYAANSS